MKLFTGRKMFDIKVGDSIKLASGKVAAVKDVLGEGGQGTVFKAEANGKEYALKWYHPKTIRNPGDFYENLSRNVAGGSPSDKFLWPLDITEKKSGRFGYLMDLKPSGFHAFSEFLCARVRFSSLSAVVNATLNITNAFRDLHRKGYSYQDLNDGNFFINPKSGEVLICDNDNVAPYGVNLGIAGKARYMAPEVARHISLPDNYSDRFSLAVVLFELLFLNHPLEGAKTLVPCMTEELELELYAKNPVFVYDPNDDSNRPNPHVHVNVVRLWKLFPEFIKEKFIRSFSKNALDAKDESAFRAARLMDSEWQTAFLNLRSCLVKCVCNDETIIDPYSESHCFCCDALIPKPMLLSIGKYIIPLFPGVRLYKCHVEGSSDD
ncbi:MAG TPA: hypothetical protein DCO86_04630 [Spirochaetaceae bacterium]|nr:hypothetical protein [Spirochaetaceae bacterium]